MSAPIFYRYRSSIDAEERLEDAALGKALHDAFGGDVTMLDDTSDLPEKGWIYGGRRTTEPAKDPIYWRDPAFLKHAHRSFEIGTIELARKAVARLHEQGKGAFVKSVRSKHVAKSVPVGTTIYDALDGLIYDFDEHGPELMVQELVTMRYEWRFFAIGRRIVADSPNAAHLVPLDYPEDRLFATPDTTKPSQWRDRERLFASLHAVAEDIARLMEQEDAVIDCAEIGGKAGCVELNPMIPGNVGLFATDVRKLAFAIAGAHPRLALRADRAKPALNLDKETPWEDPI